MKIKRLRLHNFGIYAGRQEVDFSATTEDKPIVLLGGYNGRGKTTILEAILLCLYGKRSYALSETKIAYNKYLSKYINRNDATFEASIEVTMSAEIDSMEVELSVRREWSERDKGIKEEHSVFLNGKFDEILTDDWDNQMDFLMPIGMSRFFLFDGEKVSEFVDDFSEEKLKQAIKTLLGIDVIERLENDLTTIIEKNKIAKEIESNDNEVKRLQEQKFALQSELNSSQQTMVLLKHELEQKTRRLEECEKLFSSSGGAMFGKQETTLQRRITIEKKLRAVQSEIYEKLAGAAPLLLVLPLLERSSDTAKVERDCEILSHEINGVEQLFKGLEIPKELQKRFNEMKVNRQRLMQSISGNSLSLSPSGTDLLLRLCGSFPTDELDSIEKLLARKNELQKQLHDSDDYLAVEIDQKKLNKLVVEMKTLNRDITKCQTST
jgi:DNA sulfur modification protein DndD